LTDGTLRCLRLDPVNVVARTIPLSPFDTLIRDRKRTEKDVDVITA
jgi:uncharacterized protein YcaQ